MNRRRARQDSKPKLPILICLDSAVPGEGSARSWAPAALGGADLAFPILYISVPALLDEAEWRNDTVLSVVAKRQYVDWRSYRYLSIDTPAFG